jgi:predicted ATPase/class 3 adenylate cyclase
MTGLPTGTVTFLFTDIEGSTRLLQQLGDRYSDVLATHHRLLRTAIEGAQGQVMDTQGDAVFAAFPRARDALLAAIAAQRAVLAYPWPSGTAPKVRIGLHTGEPIIGETGYVGMDVHRAARIAAVGHGGQILLSDVTHGLVARDLPEGVNLRDLGEHRLKDLAHSHRLFQVVTADLPADFPGIRSLDALPNNLPRQLTSFIGREKEIAEVKRLLSTAYIVTLTGPGGAGKTRLALQVAADVAEGYQDGVWLAEFAPIADSALVPKTVASALNMPEQPGREMTETLVDVLRPKALLLVLDNCEHLLSACSELTDVLLRACPNLRILATSREGLGIAGELTYSVLGLSLPDSRGLATLESLRQFEAVRLFVERASFSQAGFVMTERNAPAVAQVCSSLDGIPLAIELAAARVKGLSVEQIASRLGDRFLLLTEGSRTALPRHQTLRATMDWSYGLLTESERVLLRRVSVFAGGFTLEAAEGICSGEAVAPSEVLTVLLRLVDRSLVVARDRSRESRYRLLETVRQYAWQKLVETGEANEMQRRHLGWYLGLAEQADGKLRGPEQQVWLDLLEAEHDNLRAALEWSKRDPSLAGKMLQLATALLWFWQFHGHWSEGRRWLEAADSLGGEAAPYIPAKALRYASFLAVQQGDYARAAVLGQQGVTSSRESGDEESLVYCRTVLGRIALHRGDCSQAAMLFEGNVDLCRKLNNEWLLGWSLSHLGFVARDQGDYARAAALHSESLALFQKTGDKHFTAWALRGLGIVALRRGDHKQAASFCRESLTLSREIGGVWQVEQGLAGLAGAAALKGQYEQAARLFASAEALRTSLGRQRSISDQADYDKRVASTRAGLGDTAFAAAWTQGTTMTLEQAIEYALAVEAD